MPVPPTTSSSGTNYPAPTHPSYHASADETSTSERPLAIGIYRSIAYRAKAMAPVKVFGSARSTNVARVLVCLEEVGAEYEVVNIDFQAKEHKSPEHLARNVSTVTSCHFTASLSLSVVSSP